MRWSEEDFCDVGSIPDLCSDKHIEILERLLEIHDEWIGIIETGERTFSTVRDRRDYSTSATNRSFSKIEKAPGSSPVPMKRGAIWRVS